MRKILPGRAEPGCIALLGAAILMTQLPCAALAEEWLTSPDFPADSLVPSQLPGTVFQGWEDRGGGWITNDGPNGDELWHLVFERDGVVTVAIVVPEDYAGDGSVESWRVRTSLLLDSAAATPIMWEGCVLASGAEQPIFARWAPGEDPSEIWTFSPSAGVFEPLEAADIDCYEFGPE